MEPSDPTPAPLQRVFVLARIGRDTEVLEDVLRRAGGEPERARDLDDVLGCLGAGIAAVVLTEESLKLAQIERLVDALAEQPPWSEVPVILLLANRRPAVAPLHPLARLAATRGVIVHQRRVPAIALESSIRAALQGRRQQSKVRDLLVRERLAREQAEAATRTKDEFLAMVSHELRTPLSAILMWARILSDQKPGEEQVARGLQSIVRSAQAQSQLIEDLLDVARMMTGKLRVELHRRPVAPVLEAALEVIRPTAQAKGIRLDLELDSDAAFAFLDSDRLQQVLWNLLSNAVKFTPRGGVVSVRSATEADHIRVTVSDTGKGIEPSLVPHVFERFRQGDPAMTRRHGGLGLGLTIAHQLVELHGGEIDVKSEGVGKGATFTVRLPIAETSRRDELRLRPQGRRADRALTGVSVLLVEDDPELRVGISWSLENEGATVTAFDSAPPALALLRSVDFAHRPHLLISDIGLPGQDGLSLLREVRAAEQRHSEPPLPAIALTAYAGDDDRQRALDAGFQRYLAKPLTPSALERAVREVLQEPGPS